MYIREDYFNWLYNLVAEKRFAEDISFRKLLRHLYYTKFTHTIPRDANRAEDGIGLRSRFIDDDEMLSQLDGPCSVLEMMVCLAINCEEKIMDDPKMGDRTSQWFWEMIVSLGLGGMTDDRYDEDVVEEIIAAFLNRDYEPDGRGGLFTVRNCDQDLRDVEIWVQLLWYLDSIT